MIKLPEQFKRKGMMYDLEARNEFVALYRVTSIEANRVVGYEVWKIRIAKESEMFGRVIEEHEIIPTDEDFGTYAWSFDSYGTAVEWYENKHFYYYSKSMNEKTVTTC